MIIYLKYCRKKFRLFQSIGEKWALKVRWKTHFHLIKRDCFLKLENTLLMLRDTEFKNQLLLQPFKNLT